VADAQNAADERPPGTIAVYRTIMASRIRSQTTYRASFTLDVIGAIGFVAVELIEVFAIFHNVDVLGGLDFAASLLVFGLARSGFALADTVIGHLNQLGSLVREGKLEVLLVRPAPTLAQIVTLDFQPRRIGAALASLGVLGVAFAANDIAWTPAHVALAVLAPVAAAAIFAALWIVAGAWQLWLVDADAAVNTFTAGGGYAADFPSSIFPQGIRQVFTFVIPAAFAGYLPTLALIGQDGPPGLPAWLGWFTPLVALIALSIAVVVWQRGLRFYTGAGG
jgi:ABC-2 type transport system permease protein